MIEIEHFRGKCLSLEERIIDALRQDSGELGDVTTLALIEKDKLASAEFVVKANTGIISGIRVVQTIFKLTDPDIDFEVNIPDGSPVKKGDIIATVSGKARNILTAERVSLEFIRRMSGIATKTNLFVQAVEGTGTIILDTRKINPGYGELDKQAVRDGGGTNHRRNLSEMGLIKNNHIDVLGGDITLAVKLFRDKYPQIPLEVEVRNENELIVALISEPDRILLDNMSNEETQTSVYTRNRFHRETGKYIPLEASGNMTIERVRSVALTGVDYISVGELTHSVQAFDISLHINLHK